MRCRFLALAALLSIGPVSSVLAVDPWDTPDGKWRLGPVKYLLTKEEDQEFKKLKTDEERKTFVDQFWTRRDPDPKSPENEYRDTFYQRAREAAGRFSEDNGKGWQDDRGKVYILIGPPDETKQGASLVDSSGSSTPGSAAPGGMAAPGGYGGAPGGTAETSPQAPRKTVTFVYRVNPFTGKPERFELNFHSEVTGGYRLEEKIDWTNPAVRGLSPPKRVEPAATAAPGAPNVPAAPSSAPKSPPSIPPEVATPQAPETTPQSELMKQVRTEQDLKSTIPLDTTLNFYKAAKGTFATVTLEVKKSALPANVDPSTLLLAAEIVSPETGESVQRFFKPEQFGGYEGNAAATDVLLFQAERPLNPGKYKAIFAIKEPGSGAIGKLEKELLVPDYGSGDLSISSVTLARKAEPLVEPPPPDKMTPFVIGNFKVVPRPDSVFKPGDEATVYYQIYNATTDPTTNVAKMELSYTVEVNITGTWRMLGGRPVLYPGQTGLVQVYSVSLANRPPGDYRMMIKVTDALATPPKTATAEVPFKVVGSAPSKAKAKSKG